MTKDKGFTEVLECGHCGNRAPMEIIAHCKNTLTRDKDDDDWDVGTFYQIALCPTCKSATIRSYFWHEAMGPENVSFKYLYPVVNCNPAGLPTAIDKAYSAAMRVRLIDANAFAVLLGRVLELVCEDQKAAGKTLDLKLSDLAKRDIIPSKLVVVARQIRQLRNIGAHASLGELSPLERPILEDLCNAILEYVYTAPHLVVLAEERLRKVKKKSK